jgi:multidrug resistance efflux pump
VKAKVAGELRSLSVREGMAINKGDVVGQIDPTDYELRVKERQAQLRQAEAQWLTAQRDAEGRSTIGCPRFYLGKQQRQYDLRILTRPRQPTMPCSFNAGER